MCFHYFRLSAITCHRQLEPVSLKQENSPQEVRFTSH